MQSLFNRADWQLLESRNNFNLLKHRHSCKLIQEYTISDVSEQDKAAWTRRLRIKHQNVVGVVGCELFSLLGGVEEKYSIRVYLESVTQRLSQLWNTTRDQEAELITKVVKGFERLFMEYGGFRIQPSMVGLTLEREVKIWKSANFLDNKNNDSTLVHEQGMVRQVLGLFKKLIPEVTLDEIKTFRDAAIISSNIRNNYIPRRKPISDLLLNIHRNMEREEGMRSSYETEAPRPMFKKEKLDSINDAVRDTLKIAPSLAETDSNRKTLKSITQLIPSTKTKMDINHELYNPHHTMEYKLNLIEDYLLRDSESSHARLCVLFKYSYFHDKEVFQELAKAKGRMVDVEDIKILQRMTEILQRETKRGFEGETDPTMFKKGRSPRMSLVEIERIKRRATNESLDYRVREEKTERFQPSKVLTKEERIQQALAMKKEAEKLLFG